MTPTARLGTLLPALALWLVPTLPARAVPCTDGVDCVCDTIAASHPDVIFCDDFENPDYDVAGPLVQGHAWRTAWGVVAQDNCEGEAAGCPFNVVTPGNCQATGETDCVHDGNQSLGFKYVVGEEGGGVGLVKFSPTPLKTLGITYAVRYSPTFHEPDFTPASEGCAEPHTGVKTNFLYYSGDAGSNRSLPFGGSETVFNSCDPTLAACTPSSPCGSLIPNSHPFGASYKMENCTDPTTCDDHAPSLSVGWHCNAGFHMNFYPDPTAYDYDSFAGQGNGTWMCVQVHWRNYGELDSQLRHWVNGVKVIDAAYVDTTRARGNQNEGFDTLRLDSFYNGCYNGPDLAYRYEDDIVITTGEEPVPCSDIGFPEYAPPPPGPLEIDVFEADPGQGNQPLATSLRGLARGGTPPYTYQVDCDDGQFWQPAGSGLFGGMPFYTSCPPYQADGSPYYPTLRVIDSAVPPAEVIASVQVDAIDPTALTVLDEDFSAGLSGWSTEYGSFSATGGRLDPGTDPADNGDWILHDTPTNWISQNAMVEVSSYTPSAPGEGKCLGLTFRANGYHGPRYNLVYCDFNAAPAIKWERDDGDGSGTKIQEVSWAPFLDGTWLAGEIRGVGNSTEMRAWVFGQYPGGRSSWGPPHVVFDADPANPVDSGRRVGVNVFRTDPTEVVTFDNFSAVEDIDTDGDGLIDAHDNCALYPNPAQYDSDQDGFGNYCDADFNGDGVVGIPDFGLFRSVYDTSVPPTSPDFDLVPDGLIGLPDFNRMRMLMLEPLGPSGLYCAGSPPCPPLL